MRYVMQSAMQSRKTDHAIARGIGNGMSNGMGNSHTPYPLLHSPAEQVLDASNRGASFGARPDFPVMASFKRTNALPLLDAILEESLYDERPAK